MIKPDLKDYAIGALTVALLVSLSFALQPEATHVCRDLMITMACDRLSSTGLTCYPFASTTAGKKYCSTGWELILSQEPETPFPDQGLPAQYLCDNSKCTRIR